MRICYLNHDLNSNTGAGRFGLNIVKNIVSIHSEVQVAVLTSVGSGYSFEHALLNPSAWRLFFLLPKIRAIFKTCDIIHALDGFPYGVIATIASFGLGKKLIITAIGTGAIQAFRHPVKGAFLYWAYRRADMVVAISNYIARKIHSKMPHLSIVVINHAVDYNEFASSSDSELSDEERSAIATLKPYVISVGGWKERKGFEYSFRAFAEIKRSFPKMNYVIVGAANPKLRLSEPIGITDRVFYFKGIRRPFLRALYRNAELFMLLPYDDRGDVEGFGFVFLEAASAGLPVVGTHESGAEDALRDGENGFLVAQKNSFQAAEAALSILLNPARKKRFSKASLAFARSMSWESVVGRYHALYTKLRTG